MDAHDREYAAAAAAMSDRDCESGRVVLVVEGEGRRTEIVVEAENGQSLRVIDPRPWPVGNLLPF